MPTCSTEPTPQPKAPEPWPFICVQWVFESIKRTCGDLFAEGCEADCPYCKESLPLILKAQTEDEIRDAVATWAGDPSFRLKPDDELNPGGQPLPERTATAVPAI